LPKSLQVLITYPFTDEVSKGIKGDYLNGYLTVIAAPGYDCVIPPVEVKDEKKKAQMRALAASPSPPQGPNPQPCPTGDETPSPSPSSSPSPSQAPQKAPSGRQSQPALPLPPIEGGR
jgi:phospholipid/cholesterol/gamma-HCH transport system substrate-binding protein